ncbi:NAD(+) diphosphatase [Mannheimia pernigra]|uniref:NAD(+) diphosphatase n=1 Tax=Mannheimia pernigra TaxID=111844 RepID=UPI001318F934|nr:NAD(+) diphosphatase [Mannheimia pernigra]QHB18320.1 NAD(+) diphosphatase [Mannheimia pernigra]
MNKGYWIIVKDFDIALVNGEIPCGLAEEFGLNGREKLVIGSYQNLPVYLVKAREEDNHCEFAYLRTQIGREPELSHLLHRAVSLNHFFGTHRFCGKCGEKTVLADNEIAVHCNACGNRAYPTISPSIIVAIRKGRQILLANHLRHKGTIYTTLAGFVEAGEPVENAVHREIFEETGLKVKNVSYFGSQPWAFPNSLMLGFLADYESGEITLQEEEICDAQWFDYDDVLPEIPQKGTIAFELIQATLKLCREE